MSAKKEITYKGLSASKGISMGKPFVYRAETPSYMISANGKFSEQKEIDDYLLAIEQSKKELNKVFNFAKEKLDEKGLMIFEAQLEFLNDQILHERILKRVKKEKAHAYKIFVDEIAVIENNLLASRDEYLRERVADIEDIKNRVLRSLNKKKLFSKIDENCIVVSRNLTPADTILFSNRNMLGFVIEQGSVTSHLAIIARSINLPAVVGIPDISRHINPKDYLIIDGYKGVVIKNPSKETISKYKEQIKKNEKFEKSLTEIEDLPTVTKDGQKFKLSVNLEFNQEIDYVITHTNCGIGLYRTEHLFMEIGDFPTEEEQYKQYKLLADRLYPNVVTIRTFDIGGDKVLPISQREVNPYLGWRGIRICLDKPEIFLNQLRAILRASKKGNLKIMFPMIMSLDEIIEVKKLLQRAKDDLRKKNVPFDNNIKIGIMIEVPSSIFIANELAKEVDFFSIGTNDLVQYILAVDRDSSLVSSLYQKFHPAVLRAIKYLLTVSKENNIEVSVCGEMAGDSLGCLILLGMGVDELSVESKSFLRIKKELRHIKFSDLLETADKVLAMDSEKTIREYLEKTYRKFI